MSENTPVEQSTMSRSTTNPPSIACAGPADELLDPNRQSIINELLDLLELTEENSSTWALLWFASQESLKGSVQDNQPSQDPKIPTCLLGHSLSLGILFVLRAWARRVDLREQQIAETMNRNPGRLVRNTKADKSEDEEPSCKKQRVDFSDSDSDAECDVDPAEELCKQRDHNRCVLTGFREPIVVARIFPYDIDQLKDSPKQRYFFYALRLYREDKKIESWETQINSEDIRTSCANMLCMSIHAYHLWLKARFALRPVSLSEDKTRLTVQFYWLARRRYKKKMNPRRIPRPFPDDLSASYTIDGEVSAMLFNLHNLSALRSSDVLVFKTDDSVARPLPSLELMEMQWCLHRMLALSGAPDATDEQLNPKECWMLGYESEDADDSEDNC